MKTKALILVGLLIAATCTAMAITNKNITAPPATNFSSKDGVVALFGRLTQDKIYAAGERIFDLVLTLTADEIMMPEIQQERPVDMVIVLDRSGSMAGAKIKDAQKAVRGLLEKLSARDRFALVTYSNNVQSSGLWYATAQNRHRLFSEINAVYASGGTNLGAGLARGIDMLASVAGEERIGKVILISDGRANQGITDPEKLAAMAKTRKGMEFAVTTVGVGNDFNEQLMTTIADGGRGTYYYLEKPEQFLAVFTEEFKFTRAVAATSLFIHVPLPAGVEVVCASGYPVSIKNNEAVISPGDLLSGQTKTVYISMRAKNSLIDDFSIKNIRASYAHNGKTKNTTCPGVFDVQITDESSVALGSIDKKAWEQKVITSDFNALREEVAKDIKQGKKEHAISRILKYQYDMGKVNESVDSLSVAQNIEKECGQLRSDVEDTFTGDKPSVARKQKSTSKIMQYQGYKGRRGKN